ncbi:MAG: UPF0158 family protein [Candidatus Cyclobacteriaceae bacterium M2_1C_046]
MKPTEKHIEEIAELLDSGMICYFHLPTGTIEYHPDPNDPYFEPEFWQDTIDQIESDLDNYEQFEKMDSNQGFRIMEDFAYSLTDEKFKTKILDRLSQRKPFQNFKILIDSSTYRGDWFEFKKNAYIDWVKRQIGTGE